MASLSPGKAGRRSRGLRPPGGNVNASPVLVLLQDFLTFVLGCSARLILLSSPIAL